MSAVSGLVDTPSNLSYRIVGNALSASIGKVCLCTLAIGIILIPRCVAIRGKLLEAIGAGLLGTKLTTAGFHRLLGYSPLGVGRADSTRFAFVLLLLNR